jgi:hypothetical protein
MGSFFREHAILYRGRIKQSTDNMYFLFPANKEKDDMWTNYATRCPNPVLGHQRQPASDASRLQPAAVFQPTSSSTILSAIAPLSTARFTSSASSSRIFAATRARQLSLASDSPRSLHPEYHWVAALGLDVEHLVRIVPNGPIPLRPCTRPCKPLPTPTFCSSVHRRPHPPVHL